MSCHKLSRILGPTNLLHKHYLNAANIKLKPCTQSVSTCSPKLVNLAYELNDKYNSPNALVIGHGLFASKASWKAMAKRINEATKAKVYTVDMRNHGNSEPYVNEMNYLDMSRDLAHFIENVVVQKDKCTHITLMGHSMGGKTAMSLALTNPAYFNKLIVADISPSTSPSNQTIRVYLDKMSSIDMTVLDSNLFRARKQVDAKLCEVESLRNDVNQRQFLLTRLCETSGKIHWGFNLPSIRNHINDIMEFPEFHSKFDKPTMFVGGELSPYITEKEVPFIQKYFTNFKIVKVPKAGHVIHFDNPSETIRIIQQFVTE